MLIIDDDSVYEIDEECVRKNPVSPECMVYEKLRQKHQKEDVQKNIHSRNHQQKCASHTLAFQFTE